MTRLTMPSYIDGGVTYDPTNSFLAADLRSTGTTIYDCRSGAVVTQIEGASNHVWAPDGSSILVQKRNRLLLATLTGVAISSFKCRSAVTGLAWTKDADSGPVSADYSVRTRGTGSVIVRRHDPASLDLIWERSIPGRNYLGDSRPCISSSPNGAMLALTNDPTTIAVIAANTGIPAIETTLPHEGLVNDSVWVDDETLAVASGDGLVYIWNVTRGRLVNALEGHVGQVTKLALHPGGMILSSGASDGYIIHWHTGKWDYREQLRASAHSLRIIGLQYLPLDPNVLAVSQYLDNGIGNLPTDVERLLSVTSDHSTTYYSNAKVVLVGDTGVGKSGLAQVLTGQSFAPTESTHARHVWPFEVERIQVADTGFAVRETLLWDLAGQPGYRLIHQLHLADVELAIVVFDSRSETDPFGGVRHWSRALDQAARVGGGIVASLPKLLVAARADRGGIAVSPGRLSALQKELGLGEFFETSAKEGWNIEELRAAIQQSIHWDAIPRVSSTELLFAVRAFLMERKVSGSVLTSTSDLIAAFRQWNLTRTEIIGMVGKGPLRRTGSDLLDAELPATEKNRASRTRDVFHTCIGRLQARGLIRRLSFGDLVLLQPEYLDAYASSIVMAARSEPDGLGEMSEQDILGVRFPISKEERVPVGSDEQLLLVATIEELLKHEVALRESTSTGELLIFPSQLSRAAPPHGDSPPPFASIKFGGAVANIYATLVVRLSNSGFFRRTSLWSTGSLFDGSGHQFGLQASSEEGGGEITVSGSQRAPAELRSLFVEFVHDHISGKAPIGSIRFEMHFLCPRCGEAITHRQAALRAERGYSSMKCPVCQEGDIDLQVRVEWKSDRGDDVEEMQHRADVARREATATAIIRGKRLTSDYDVLVIASLVNEDFAARIVDQLTTLGMLPWLMSERDGIDELGDLWKRMRAAIVITSMPEPEPWDDSRVNELLRTFMKSGREVLVIVPAFAARTGYGKRSFGSLRYIARDRWINMDDSTETDLHEILEVIAYDS